MCLFSIIVFETLIIPTKEGEGKKEWQPGQKKWKKTSRDLFCDWDSDSDWDNMSELQHLLLPGNIWYQQCKNVYYLL